jgi:hypothetical protein
MPKSEERRRGGVLRYRTISLGDGKYAHVVIVKKRGKRGGRTVMGKVRVRA